MKLEVKADEPVTTLQIRLRDGTRCVLIPCLLGYKAYCTDF